MEKRLFEKTNFKRKHKTIHLYVISTKVLFCIVSEEFWLNDFFSFPRYFKLRHSADVLEDLFLYVTRFALSVCFWFFPPFVFCYETNSSVSVTLIFGRTSSRKSIKILNLKDAFCTLLFNICLFRDCDAIMTASFDVFN